MSAERLRQKEEFAVQLTILFGPILRLVDYPERYDDQARKETIAQYSAEYFPLTEQFEAFCDGQPGHSYDESARDFENALTCALLYLQQNTSGLPERIRTLYHQAHTAITIIPIPRNTMTFEAHTPFSTYRILKALCVVEATKSVIWIDPYLDTTIFDRYVGDVRPEAAVTLITALPRGESPQSRRWIKFLDLSQLYAKERGPDRYRLVVLADGLHDRWAFFDHVHLFSMGGSAKDAGDKQYFTLTRLDTSPANLDIIESLLKSGTEYFGPSTPVHRTGGTQ